MSKIKTIRKALTAAGALAVAYGLLDEGTVRDILTALTPVLVYLVPND